MNTKRSWSDGSAVEWQAHRGGGGFERPDNTMTSFVYGWSLGGIPEADVRQTKDGTIVCLHDPTLERTTDAPAEIARVPVKDLEYNAFAEVDAGRKFAPEYAGERVPLLSDVFLRMKESPASKMYLDLKEIDLGALAALIDRYSLNGRLCIAGPDQAVLADMKERLPSMYTLLWCGGTQEKIEAKFEAAAKSAFAGLNQVQLHLNDRAGASSWRYEAGPDFVRHALKTAEKDGVDLEVLPWKFADEDILALLDIGVRWYATDEPARFLNVIGRRAGREAAR